MTIDNRRDYNRRCLQRGLFEQAAFILRYRRGQETKRALKHYWQTIDQGKPQ